MKIYTFFKVSIFVFISQTLFSMDMSFDSIRLEYRSEGLFVLHKIEKKETLYYLSKRYKSPIEHIKKYNELHGNKLKIGDTLSILIAVKKKLVLEDTTHIVQPGETLFRIAKLYGIEISKLKLWNHLKNDTISYGQTIVIKYDPDFQWLSLLKDTTFIKYYVQTGETLQRIAKKFKVSPQKLRTWNELDSGNLSIGQLLVIKSSDDTTIQSSLLTKETTRIDENGIEYNLEEGTASIISDLDVPLSLALHKHIPIGQKVRVKNLMNNKEVEVKVVGRLPETGINKGILLRLSKCVIKELGAINQRFVVEVSSRKLRN